MAAGEKRFRPRFGWIVAAVLLAAFWSVLLVNGLVNPTIGSDGQGAVARDDGPGVAVSDAVHDGGPVIEATDAGVRAAAMPPRTVALTFDDGPDPRWTPEILEILKKHDVPATFFVVGSQVAKYPDIVRAMRAGGSEVGLHTFNHVDLARVSPAVVDEEIARTQIALAGAIGETSYLTRPPYSSGPSALTGRQLDTLRRLGADGQLTVLSDVDSRDWELPGTDAIVRSAMPDGGRGAIVLLHDGGGDRTETVEALDRLIPELRAQGYRFTTVTGGIGLPAGNRPAGPEQLRDGTILVTSVAIAATAVELLRWLLLAGAALVVLRLVIVIVVAARHAQIRRRDRWRWGPPVTAPVSVVVPAYNERACIASTVRSLAAGVHPVEVIVVDDGSTDGTADVVEALGLPGVRVIRQANAGKPAALNTGIAHARHDIIVMMDGDTVFEPTTVRQLVAPFADASVGAVAGNAKVANRSTLIGRMQHIEYVIGFNLDRRAYDLLRCMPTVPGAVGAFRRSALREVGGVSHDTLAEDTDLTMAVCGAGYRVVYEESARAWTEAPETLPQLWRQRYRWSYGTMQSMWKHRRAALGAGTGGRFGRLALGHLVLFQVLLPLLAPLIDVFMVYGLLFLDPLPTTLAWGAVLALQLAVAAYAFRLEREPLGPLLLMPLQQFVYRQLMYAVLFRSIATAVGGVRLRWQKLNRVGAANASLTSGMGRGAAPVEAGTRRVPVPQPRRPAPPAALVPRRESGPPVALPRQRPPASWQRAAPPPCSSAPPAPRRPLP